MVSLCSDLSLSCTEVHLCICKFSFGCTVDMKEAWVLRLQQSVALDEDMRMVWMEPRSFWNTSCTVWEFSRILAAPLDVQVPLFIKDAFNELQLGCQMHFSADQISPIHIHTRLPQYILCWKQHSYKMPLHSCLEGQEVEAYNTSSLPMHFGAQIKLLVMFLTNLKCEAKLFEGLFIPIWIFFSHKTLVCLPTTVIGMIKVMCFVIVPSL